MKYLMLLIVLSATTSLNAQVQLKYQYHPGETLKYHLQQNLTTTAEQSGQEMTNQITQLIDLKLLVNDVDQSKGNASLEKSIDRIRMKIEHPALGQAVEYDSATQAAPQGALAILAQNIAPMVGQTFQMTSNAQGEISDLKLPAIALEGPGGAKAGNQIKEMMSQGSLAFPQKELTQGSTWQREMTTKMPFGEMNSRITYQYLGENADGYHQIEAKTVISMTPSPGIPVQVEMKGSQGRGLYLWDQERGCLISSRLKQTMSMEVTTLNQTVKQKIDTDIVMNLVDAMQKTVR